MSSDDHPVHEDAILSQIERLERLTAPPPTEIARIQAIIAGYQALDTQRLVNAVNSAAQALHRLANSFEEGSGDAAKLREALEGIRKTISANGS